VTTIEENPGYSEDDIQELVKDRRFLAAVHNYALHRLTLGQAIIMASSQPSLVPERFKLNLIGYERAVHEIAKRILSGRLVVPSDLRDEYSDIYSGPVIDAPPHFQVGPPRYKFSELESLPAQINPLTRRRKLFNDNDIRELTNDPCFLACIDAYRQGIVTLGDVLERAFGDRGYPPRLLAHDAFRDLAFEVVRRIGDGRVPLPGTLRQDCAFAYEPGTAGDRAYE